MWLSIHKLIRSFFRKRERKGTKVKRKKTDNKTEKFRK
jgi:hypothetical protein